MKNKKNKIIEMFLLTGILTILLIPIVSSSIGLATDYNARYPITLEPGETRDIVFGRLKSTEEVDVTINIELLDGGDIATLTNQNPSSFIVPAGSKNTEITLRVSIPEDTTKGTEDKITIKYTGSSSSEGEGMIGFTESKTITLPVLVEIPEKPEIPGAKVWTVLLLIIILMLIIIAILIVYFIFKRKK